MTLSQPEDPFFDVERFLTSTESDFIEVDEAAGVTVPAAARKAV
jgi:hypothetical protein